MSPRSGPEPRGPRRILHRLLDTLYPCRCGLCDAVQQFGRHLCGDCDAGLPRLREPFCERCGEPFDGRIDGSFTCPNCKGLRFAFDFARPALVRDERTLDLIHRLKYGREVHLAEALGRLAMDAFTDPRLADALRENWPLVPVPLHRSRLRKRHFNQALEIGRTLSPLVGLPIRPLLRRLRDTATQTALSRRQRMENLRGAFGLTRAGHRLARDPSGVVLLDDVLTTGSTVHECARTLRGAGFRRIAVVTVMRG